MFRHTPFGRLLLAETLAEDPFGTVHRALKKDETHSSREVLVRRYHAETLNAGLSNRMGETRKNLVQLGNLKAFQGCHLILDHEPHLVWPYAPGRSLFQVLARAEREHIPFGVDQALFIGWSLAHHISQLHRASLPLGFLTPHRVWVGFDGFVQLLDAPVILPLREALSALPEAQQAVSPYLQGPAAEGLPHDLFQLGALLYEMLTHHPLPAGALDLDWVLAEATLPDPEGRTLPMPSGLVEILRRLLRLHAPYRSLEHLEEQVEAFLFGGEYDPTTFGLAFTMQTLFREERVAEQLVQEEERSEPSVFHTLEKLAEGAPMTAVNRAPRPVRERVRWGLLVSVAGLLLAGSLVLMRSPRPQDPKQSVGGGPVSRKAASLLSSESTQAPPLPPAKEPSEPGQLGSHPAPHPHHPAVTPRSSRAEPREGLPSPLPPSVLQPAPSAPTSLQPALTQAGEPPKAVTAIALNTPAPLTTPPRLLGPIGPTEGEPLRVRVFVDERGRPRQAFVQPGHGKSDPTAQQACATAMKARFEAARKGSEPVRDWVEITVRVK